ncbi:MAG: SDR family oxidoreductase [Pseudomonadales bacterium]|nr:SDR family oxidoreductase [Pseudomonadales bacterium]MBO6566645.1 SDR family oxidoreductase [Pseudomonadales bacterium]MBO6594980.1 SDR family oxidoreductase [Pseudomonadales bacterium]MBO6657459.1 SDR family oxidoreductase [Pseudomonadales bacterium]MBO6821461.1 SDR family oxidoreductase [Pseudomonadales bacterium]
MSRLENKVAIITGGAGGIGKVAGKMFAEEGADVLLVDIDEQMLKAACEEAGSNRVSYLVADVSTMEGNQAMVDAATERYGGLDVFMANAGIEGDMVGILDYDEDRFDQVMSVNVKGPFLALKAAVPAMQKRGGGSFVITSSIAGLKGAPGLSAYGTSKHAVIGLMRGAAREFADFGIRVNTVNPSPVETRMMRSIESGISPDSPEDVKSRMVDSIPLKRYAEAEDIAKLMLFLASDDSQFITGSIYSVDGGSNA